MSPPIITAHLRDAQETGSLAMDLGPRLRGLKVTTRLGFGFEHAEATLLPPGLVQTPDGRPLWTFAQVAEVRRQWNFAVLYLYADNELIFEGRVWEMEFGEAIDHPALGPCFTAATVRCRGLWADLTTRADIELPDELTEEGTSPSALDVIKAVIGFSSRIDHNTNNLVVTGVDLDPIREDDSHTAYDYVADAVQAGMGNGDRLWFGIFRGSDGCYLRSRDTGQARWSFSIVGSGLGIGWNLEHYANKVVCNAVDGENAANQRGETETDDTAEALHGGISQTRIISINQGGQDAANAAAAAVLQIARDPLALTGNLRLTGRAPNAERGMEPVYRVRCGDFARIDDVLMFDPYLSPASGRLWIIESTSYDAETDTVEVTFDEQRARPPRSQSIAAQRDAAMVGASVNNPNAIATIYDDNSITPGSTETAWAPGTITFRVSQTRNYHLQLDAEAQLTSATDEPYRIGFVLDSSQWSSGSGTEATRGYLYPNGKANLRAPARHALKTRLRRGDHTITAYCVDENNGGWKFQNWKLSIR